MLNALFGGGGEGDYRVVWRQNLSDADAEKLAQSKKRRSCANDDCTTSLTTKSRDIYTKAKGYEGDNGKLTKIGGAVYHRMCAPGQTWSEVLSSGTKAAFSGAVTGAKKYPWITAAAGVALAGIATYAMLSRGAIDTVCFKDAIEPSVAWCADVVQGVDGGMTSAVFEKYVALPDWVHSGEFATRTYDEVNSGARLVYDTVSKFFVRSPFEVIAQKFA